MPDSFPSARQTGELPRTELCHSVTAFRKSRRIGPERNARRTVFRLRPRPHEYLAAESLGRVRGVQRITDIVALHANVVPRFPRRPRPSQMEKGVERLSSAVCQFFQPFQGTIFDLYVFESRKAGRPFGTLAAQRQNFRAALCQFFDESRSHRSRTARHHRAADIQLFHTRFTSLPFSFYTPVPLVRPPILKNFLLLRVEIFSRSVAAIGKNFYFLPIFHIP